MTLQVIDHHAIDQLSFSILFVKLFKCDVKHKLLLIDTPD